MDVTAVVLSPIALRLLAARLRLVALPLAVRVDRGVIPALAATHLRHVQITSGSSLWCAARYRVFGERAAARLAACGARKGA